MRRRPVGFSEGNIGYQVAHMRSVWLVPALVLMACPAEVSRPVDAGPPVVVEINPRLTSSYLGYRQLTDDNIPARLLDTNAPALRWKSEPVTFTV